MTFEMRKNTGKITSKGKPLAPSVSYEEELLEDLKNPSEAAAYLKVCLEDEDPRVFLIALGQVARANGGFSQLSKNTGLNRENLYRTLSPKGNPKIDSVGAVLRSLGMKLSVEAIGSTTSGIAHA
jgi:probable addiction module antidote protein